jgi:tetratricopeptide (TPR) repeat protein
LYFRDTQRGETAIELSKKALAKAEAVWGREDVKTQSLIDHTALFLGHERRFQEEEALLAELVEIRTRTLGEEHTNTLTAMDLLADSYCKQERFKEAEELFLSVIEKQKRTLGEDHHSTLTTMRRLAGLYRKNDKKEEGLKLFTLLEKVNRDSKKDSQYDTDAVNLAIAHMDFQQYTEAEELLKPAVERLTRTRGHNEGITLWATSVLAGVYKRQKRYKEAIALAQWCLPLLEQVCGQDHHRTVYTRSLLTSMRQT